MLRNHYSVYDVIAELFMPTIVLPSHAVCKREIANCLTDPQHQFSSNTADYSLYYIGFFNDETGFFETEKEPLKLCELTELLPKSPKPKSRRKK